jgi:site-specific DNA-methyltransferase (adenine-specific)
VIYTGDALMTLCRMPAESVHCVVTSPPYWGLRDYEVAGQLGLEATPEEYVSRMVGVFREVRRVLRADGTAWVNLGDSYAGSWGAQSRGGPPSDASTLRGNGHVRGGPKVHELSAVQVAAAPKRTMTGSMEHTPGLKPKDLVGIPWRVAFALQADGWYLRSDIIWHKPNPIPESVTDRPTKAHEYIFLLSKSARYWYDAEAIKEPRTTTRQDLLAFGDRPDVGYTGHMQDRKRAKVPAGWDTVDHGRAGNGRFTDRQRKAAAVSSEASQRRMAGFKDRWDASEDNGTAPLTRNARSVWTIATQGFSGAHFATFPEELARRCIMAGCPRGGTVLDPFAGAGTVGLVAQGLGREYVLIELKPEYAEMARKRIHDEAPLFAEGRGPCLEA